MFRRPATLMVVCALSLTLCGAAAWAVPLKGETVPSFKAVDLAQNPVDLDAIVAAKPDLIILFFFTTRSGEEVAAKLRRLERLYGGDKGRIRIVGVGWKDNEAALKKYAEELRIDYQIVQKTPELERYAPVPTLPVTLVVTSQKTVLNALSGSGDAEADLINDIAESLLRAGKTKEARAVAEEAIDAGETEKDARNTMGFAFEAEGKLDEAEKEFGRIDSKEGLASVALRRGKYDKAIAIADEASPDNGYAATVKGKALAQSGKLDEAAAALETAIGQNANDWQKSEAVNSLGRVKHEQGDTDGAVEQYRAAVAIDPLNVTALSNEGAALRDQGDLEAAASVLEKAQSLRDDELVATMLQQIQREMSEANDVKRGELVRAQIADLRERYEALKAAGKDQAIDDWTSPPVVLAFLPSAQGQGVFFERAGTGVVLRRELEARLQANDTVRVVEREVLDKLLQELQLGASELTSPDTQLQLGKVLSARMLGFVDFGRLGSDTMMYLRLIDTETTQMAAQFTQSLSDYADLRSLVDALALDVIAKVVNGRQLKGLIADAADENAVIINIGAQHGVVVGQAYEAIEKGAPIEAGGKTIAYREKKLAILEVTEVEDRYAICKVVKKQTGVTLAKDIKIKQPKK